jgi:nucleotide-binding universal stress UspA family protein
MFENLVVALDGSACAEHAFDVALQLARAQGGTIDVCSVVDPIAILGTTPESPRADEMLARAQTHAQRTVDTAIRHAQRAGVKAAGDVLSGEPAYEIIAYAAKMKADAIVMGTHGRSGLKRLFMGSVAENVLRSASVPVVVVRDRARIPSPAAIAVS